MRDREKVIYISGPNGFIGTLLKEDFKSYFKYIIPIDKDVRNLSPSDFVAPRQSNHDYYFIHLAGISSVGECEKNKEHAMDVNCNGTLAAYLAFSKCYPDGTFINMSTAHVYKASTEEFVCIDENFPTGPQSYYGETKLQAEIQLKANQQDARILNLRLFNHTHKSQSQNFFLPSVYNQMLDAKKSGAPCILNVGDLSLKRDISHISDLLLALRLLVQKRDHPEKFATFNVCSSAGKSLQLLVEFLSQNLKVSFTIAVNPQKIRLGEPCVIVGANNRLKGYIPWEPRCSVTEYLLIKSFLQHNKPA